MPNTREIKSRISGVEDTRKITNAMYLIASTKLRKAKNELDQTRPYFDALRTEIKRIFRTAKNVDSKFFYPEDGTQPSGGCHGVLVVTADKGLAGAYNQNVLRLAEKMLADHADTKLFVVGEYGRQYFESHGFPVDRSFEYTAQSPTLDRARRIGETLLSSYDKRESERIYIVYTDFKNSLNMLSWLELQTEKGIIPRRRRKN